MGEKEKEVKSNGEDLKMITVVIYNVMIYSSRLSLIWMGL